MRILLVSIGNCWNIPFPVFPKNVSRLPMLMVRLWRQPRQQPRTVTLPHSSSRTESQLQKPKFRRRKIWRYLPRTPMQGLARSRKVRPIKPILIRTITTVKFKTTGGSPPPSISIHAANDLNFMANCRNSKAIEALTCWSGKRRSAIEQ